MTWKTKVKDLPTTATVGYTSTDPNVVGRAPKLTAINFSALELFGAAARCSHLHFVDPTIATPESDMIAKLIEPHVDDVSSDFAILSTADSFKDYVKAYFAGTVAVGIGYLSMINEGYVWADHFESVGGGHPTHTRRPDFVFAGLSSGVALMESKGSRSGSLSAFDATVAGGYTDQVEPHLGHTVGGVMATHGYCIGSWLKPTSQAELRVHHTWGPVQQNGAPEPDAIPPETIQRHNFATAFTLAHSPQLGADLRRGRSRYHEVEFLRTEWLGRRWLTGFAPDSIFWPEAIYWPHLEPYARRLLRRGWPFRPSPLLIFAVEEEIAKIVLTSFLTGEERVTGVPDIRPLDEETRGAARAYRTDSGGGAVFPDGLAVLDLRKLQPKFEVVVWNSDRAAFVDV